MARYPGAEWRPLAPDWSAQLPMARYDLIILHTMAGSLFGTENYFRGDGYGGSESHFGVGGEGRSLQWQDTAYRAEANGAANPRAISIETADIGPEFPKWDTRNPSAVPPWTEDQVEEIAQICAWASTMHAIPLVPVLDSLPTRRGVAYHRLGVPGYAVTGGELWSSARGKQCPGPARIAQVPQVIERARLIRDGVPPTKRRDNVLLTYDLAPGQGAMRKIFPTGQGVIVVERAWLSFAVNGPTSGRVRVFFQNSLGKGIGEATRDVSFADGASRIVNLELPSATGQVVIQWNMPEGGTMTYEGLARA